MEFSVDYSSAAADEYHKENFANGPYKQNMMGDQHDRKDIELDWPRRLVEVLEIAADGVVFSEASLEFFKQAAKIVLFFSHTRNLQSDIFFCFRAVRQSIKKIKKCTMFEKIEILSPMFQMKVIEFDPLT